MVGEEVGGGWRGKTTGEKLSYMRPESHFLSVGGFKHVGELPTESLEGFLCSHSQRLILPDHAAHKTGAAHLCEQATSPSLASASNTTTENSWTDILTSKSSV